MLRHLLYTTLLLLAALGLASCQDDPTAVAPVAPGADEGGCHIRVLINMLPASREAESRAAHPEEGGVRNENKIEDLTLFILRDPLGLGLNASATARIIKDIYVPSLENAGLGYVQYTGEIKDYSWQAGDRMIALANMGNLTLKFTTLGELRDYVPDSTFTGSELKNLSRFAMGPAFADDGLLSPKDNGLNAEKPGTEENPLTATLSLERLAARIDLGFGNGDMNGTTGLSYKVMRPDAEEGKQEQTAWFHLTDMAPVNAMRQPSYAVKHSTVGLSLAAPLQLQYAVTEPADQAGTLVRPGHYVVEPRTAQKVASLTEAPDGWYLPRDFLPVSKLMAEVHQAGVTGFDHCITVAYANENTMDCSQHDARFITGVMLKGTLQPLKAFTDGKCESYDTPARDADIWMVRTIDNASGKELTNYFTSQAAAEAWRDANTDSHPELVYYAGGVCYYNVWLRHIVEADAAPWQTFAMEYATVRNHIYRFGITTISGPGLPTPDVREPYNIRIRLFVRKWNLKEQSEIIM